MLLGLLPAVFSTLVELFFQGLFITWGNVQRVQMGSPLLWLTDTAPLFLGLLAGIAGRRQDRLARVNQRLEQQAEERSQAVQKLEALQLDLEQQVAERTRDLERRAVQLATAAGVGRSAASILEIEALARQVVTLVRERFDLYYAGLFVVDEAGRYAVLKAGTGEPGRYMREKGHRLEVGGVSMVGAACAQRRARIALDAGAESVRFNNPLLPGTRSEMALPLVVGERVLGALDVQSTQPAAFTEEDIAVLQLVADQVAVAVDNAQKLAEEASLLETTSPVYRVSHRLVTARSLDDISATIVSSVADTDIDGCVVGLFEPSGGTQPAYIRLVRAWQRDGASALQPAMQANVGEVSELVEVFGSSWVVTDLNESPRLSEQSRPFVEGLGGRAVANFPLQIGDLKMGFFFVYRVMPGPFADSALRLYQTLSDQAALALERTRLLEEAEQRAAHDRLIREVTTRIRSTLDIRTVIESAADELYQALDLDKVVIHLAAGDAPAESVGGNGAFAPG
jgi:GAF domain-containing protein